jgi:hypothetical protein
VIDTGIVTITARDFTLSSPLIGLDRVVTATLTLQRAAPTGGATFSLSIDDTSVATLSTSTLSIPEGRAIGSFEISGGTTPSTAVITADGLADGYESNTLNITVTDFLIDVPPIPELALGETFAFNVLIAPNPAPPGGLPIAITSSDPIVEVLTPIVNIPEGEFGAPASIRAVHTGPGTGFADITASSAGFAPDTERANVTTGLNIVPSASSFEPGQSDFLFVEIRSGGERIRAPAG